MRVDKDPSWGLFSPLFWERKLQAFVVFLEHKKPLRMGGSSWENLGWESIPGEICTQSLVNTC